MPKDPTKNIDRYKIGGGMLNEFEFQKNQLEFSEQNDLGGDSYLPGSSSEGTTAPDEPTEPVERAGTPSTAKRRAPAKKRPASKKSTKKAAAKKGMKKAASKSTKKSAGKKSTKKAAAKKGTKKAGAKKSTKKSAAKKSTKKRATKK